MHIVLLALVIAAQPAAARAQTISAADAAAHMGEEVTIEGEVPTVVCSPLACLLSFTTDYSGLVASIPGDALRSFPPPKATYTARRVRVRGVVVDKNGRPRIEIRDPGQLQVLDGATGSSATAPVVVNVPVAPDDGAASPPSALAEAIEPAAPAAKPAAGDARPPSSRSRVVDPGTVATHVGAPLPPAARPSGESVVDRLSGDSSDVATVEARALRQQIAKLEEANAALNETVAALAERLTVLEQSQGSRFTGVMEAPLPEVPDYVVSADSSNHVQRVTRGWSSERVLRVLGAPLNTTTEANGYMTWYYTHGRAVTLDPRGRVTSSIGF
jgi:hypothetical protein